LRKRIPNEFGRAVLNRLLETGMTQEELIECVKEKTGKFFDGGYLYKILTGQRNAPKIIQAIREILDLPELEQDAS